MADKLKKPQKLRARLPRGLEDRGPAAIAATRAMTDKIREVYERYGFEPVETPAMEYTDALGKFLPDQDRPNEGVFSFQDDDEQWISLRYDLTAPLARYVAENFQNLALPYRSYRAGYVFRNEKPGPGRFRQFMQFDADTVGSASPAADAEMCMMAADTMEALGIPRGQYVVKVNNRKVLDGVMESIGLGGDENAGRRLTVLRAIDKADKFSLSEIRKLLGTGRWDGGEEGKGDFTKGAGLDSDQINKIVSYVEWSKTALVLDPNVTDEDDFAAVSADELSQQPSTLLANTAVVDGLRLSFGENSTAASGLEELRQIAGLIENSDYSDRIRIDPSVVRGLEYYTGPVYEVELLLETKDEKGRPVRFGSVGGGGRYDGLVSRFMGQPVPATGFSIGVSRLQAALDVINREKLKPTDFGPIVVTVFDRDRIADYQRMVNLLRNSPVNPKKPNGAKIRAELYLGSQKSVGHQLKYADKRNSPLAIMQGSNEKNPGKGRKPRVIIKDLVAGAAAADMSSDRADYLAKQNEAQISVLEKYLVSKVQKILARHNVKWN